MSRDEQAQWIVPTTGAKTLPAIEILTGRGFVTGKSGSGKSNTGGVIAEQLLDNNYNMLVVDPEGEYYGLKEEYEILHVGNDELCDVQVTPNHAEQLATIALERNMPIILDVSDFLDADQAKELIANVVRELFQKEKEARKPFLLMIEEMQEYLPQQGGNDELSELLERIAKRGRKRGLGMLGMSQRPSSVDKDFITQCDWMVWHRLTWQNDLDVVRKVLGTDVAEEVEDLDTGEGYLMTDWDESVDRVQFKRKRTHDAGATPGLESYERPDLKSVSQDLVNEIRTGVGGGPEGDGEDATDLDPAAQADLNEAVETVEVEGPPDDVEDARSDDGGAASGSVDAGDGPTGGSTVQTADATSVEDDPVADATPGAVADSSPDPSAEPVTDADLDTADGPADLDADPASMDESDLRDHAETLRRRNRILEDEVNELRSILQNVERASGDGDESDAAPPTTASNPNPAERPASTPREASQAASAGGTRAPATRQPSTGRGPTPRSGSTSGAGAPSPRRPPVRRPTPPEPPAERTGVAGTLVEFVEMTGYLTRSLGYRCRLLVYRLRRVGKNDDGEGSINP